MDAYQTLQAKAVEVAQQVAGRKTPMTYVSDNGVSVQGWVIKSSSYSTEKHFGRGSFRETWGNKYRVLTTDGRPFDHSHDYVETEEGRTETQSLEECNPAMLLGRGSPFSEITTKLERLPWTA
jgi:hypothetical protein